MRAFALNPFRRPALWVLAYCGIGVALPLDRAAAQVNTSVIKLSYRCGNWFRARNYNSVDVPVTYAVYRTTESKTLTLPAAPPSVGYSDTWFQTTQRGAVLLTYNSTRIAEKPNANAACASVASVGQWSDTVGWPIMAVAAALLPNGKVLTWGREYASSQNPPYVIPPGKSNGIPNLWDPVADPGVKNTTPVDDDGIDLFCAGAAFLTDGRLLVVGGASKANENLGQRYANIFDYSTNSWTSTPNMADGRWYPGVATLTNGSVFIMLGTDTNQIADSIPEVYNPSTNAISELTGFPKSYGGINYWSWLTVGPNGQVFYAGDRGYTYYINTSGSGSGGQAFFTVENAYRDYGSPVMYDAGKMLIVGGGHTLATAEIIDLTQGSPQWQMTGSMNFPRRQMNAVLLANGQVMASGGSAGPDFNPATNIVYTPEIWNPATGVWTVMPNYRMPRLYHSETLLLPDGRVLSVGGGQPAATGLADNFNAEFYSPAYLFNPDGSPVTASRPIITAAPTSTTYNSSLQLSVQNVAGTASVLWIRLGVVTHAFNVGQRLNHLPVVSQTGQTITVTTPANSNLAPPGHYLLFVFNGNGVPSVGTIVHIQ